MPAECRRNAGGGAGIGANGGGPLPRPLPVRSSRRGENSSARRMDHAASAGAPSGSPRLPPPPKLLGEVGGADGSALCDLHRTAPDGGPSPGTSPLVPHGEGENSSARRMDHAASAGAPSGSLRLATSPKTAGGGWGEDGARLGDWTRVAPDAPPRPLPPLSFLRERGEFERASESLSSASPFPALFAGEGRDGAAGGRSEMLTPAARRSSWGGRAAPRLRERRCRRRLSG